MPFFALDKLKKRITELLSPYAFFLIFEFNKKIKKFSVSGGPKVIEQMPFIFMSAQFNPLFI
jgi:hypothetical protein